MNKYLFEQEIGGVAVYKLKFNFLGIWPVYSYQGLFESEQMFFDLLEQAND